MKASETKMKRFDKISYKILYPTGFRHYKRFILHYLSLSLFLNQLIRYEILQFLD